MKKKIFKSFFASTLFLAFFLFGLQQSAHAQITVINTTDCDIYFGVSQAHGVTSCTECQRPEDTVDANDTVIINAIPCLGVSLQQHWMYIKFGVLPNLTGGSISYNPNTACAVSVFNSFCTSFNAIQVDWTVDPSTGATTVRLF